MKIGSPEWEKVIRESVPRGTHIDDEMMGRFFEYTFELLRWNHTTNLTAITDPLDIAVKHLADSISPASDIGKRGVVLDIGSGGGFPGIPLKIANPGLTVTLIDASRKKVSFMRHVIRHLNLTGITALHARAEELAKQDTYLKFFEVVISRALSDLTKYLALALPLVSKPGTIIAMKGRLDGNEVSSARSFFHRTFPGEYALEVRHYSLPFDKGERSSLIFRLGCAD